MLFAIWTWLVPSQRLKILDIHLYIKNIYILAWQILSVKKDLKDHLVQVFFICNPWIPRQHCVCVCVHAHALVCTIVHVCIFVSCQCLRLSWAQRDWALERLSPDFVVSPIQVVETAFIPSPVAPHFQGDFYQVSLSEPQDLVSVSPRIVVQLQQKCFLIAECHVNVWL